MTTNALILSRIAADLRTPASTDQRRIDTTTPQVQDDDPGLAGSPSSGRASRRPMRSMKPINLKTVVRRITTSTTSTISPR